MKVITLRLTEEEEGHINAILEHFMLKGRINAIRIALKTTTKALKLKIKHIPTAEELEQREIQKKKSFENYQKTIKNINE